MLDGRLSRLAILLLVVLPPLAGAAPPSPNRAVADGTGDQEITDMAADPSGQFLAAVVAVDAAVSTPLGGITGGDTASSKPDVFMCDYGPAIAPTSGGGCVSGSHAGLSATVGAQQRVDATTVIAPNGGRQGVFAVAGPGATVSQWRQTSTSREWTGTTQDSYNAVGVAIAPDASRVAVGTTPASGTGAGRIEMRGVNGSTQGGYLWHVNLENPEGVAVLPNALDWSRTGNVLAIGTTAGVLLLDPAAPAGPLERLAGIAQPGSVSSVQTSRDGRYVVAAGANGVYLFETTRTGTRVGVLNSSLFNRGLGEASQEVAISLDGARFAAAAGSKVHFFVRTNDFALARSAGDAYDVGARIADMAYDETGEILVVVAGSKVLGFGPNRNTPIWQFDGPEAPMKKVAVSDDGQRILVAGKTKTMAYSSTIAVAASLATTSGATSVQPTQVVPMTLSVRNAGSLSDNYSFVVEPPIGWAPASAEGIRLDPEEIGTIRFNLTVPAAAPDGAYGVKVRVRSETNDELAQRRNQATGYLAEPSFNFTIPRSVVLKVEAPDDLVDVTQGSPETIAFVVRNEGNAEGVVNLSITQDLSSGRSWDHRFEPGEQVRIAPGRSETVNLVLTAPTDVAKGGENVITIHAREGTTVEATDRIVASIEPEFGTQLATNRSQWDFYPGQTHTITVNVTNTGNVRADFNLSHTITPTDSAGDWRVSFSENKVAGLEPGVTARVIVTVKAQASEPQDATLTLRATPDVRRGGADADQGSPPLALSLVVVERPPEPEKEDGNFLPAPGFAPAVLLVALVALARRLRGGRAE